MSEDSRSGRKPSRQLYIANPGSDDDDPKQLVANARPNVPITVRHPLNPPASSPYKPSPPQSNPTPAPDQPPPDSHHHHQRQSQSSSSPDNSASPSSPPTTPGFPSSYGLSYDRIDASSTPSYAPALTPGNDRAYTDSQVPPYKITRPPKQYIKPPSGGRPLPQRNEPRRPNFTSHDQQSSPAIMSASPDRVIIATKDSDVYVAVDLSGVRTAPQMRELILSKLKIYTEDEGNPYLIYQTEIGAYAIGEPLSDARLLSLCREQGDSKGTLKFLVTHPFAPVHEPPPPSQPMDYCPMPPPAHAAHVPIKPLRTKPRQSSRSRNGSISSSSEILTPEIANGYDADIDNPEASPPKPSSLPPSPPRRPSLGNEGRSSSPDQPTSPPPAIDRRINGRKDDRLTHALPPIPQVPPPAPPSSPHRPSFPSHGDLSPSLPVPSDRHRHARSGSDAGADRELSSRTNDAHAEGSYRLRNGHHSSLTHLKSPPSRDNVRTQSRRPTYDDDDNGQEIIMPNGGRSGNDFERHSPTLQRRNQYGQRPTSPYTSRSHMTQNPARGLPAGLPPVAPSETRPMTKIRGQLPLGNAFVPYNFAESAHKKQPPTSSTSWPSRLAKNSTKSMDNLKFASQSGSSRRTPIPPTPQLPIMSNTNSRDVAYSPSSTLSLSGMPKSYDTSPRFVRPLPQKGLPPGNSFDIPSASSQYSSRAYPPTLTSPNYEPFPRPQSAASDAISPTRSIPHSHSPVIYGSSLDLGEHNRSPRTVSPNRSYHSPGFMGGGGGGPRPRPTNGDRSDGPDHSPPPLTPQDPQLDERGIVDPSPPLSPRGILDKDSNSSSELTLKEDGQRYFAKLLGNATPTGTQVTSPTSEQTRPGKRLTPSPPPLERNDSSSTYAYDDDDYDSYIGGGTWIVKPEPGKNAARPPLKVQIEAPTRSSTAEEDERPELPPKDIPPSRPPPVDPNLLRVQARRPESTFIDPDSDNWAPRPPPENIYEELEKFFPKHDLDKPVIEASSGDTSPTNVEPVAALPPMPIPDDRGRIRAKKSIRLVAQEHKKRIDRTSKAADAIAQKDNMMRKRSTKLWGSRLEEVTTLRNNSTISLPESPSGGPTTFKWVRGELIGKGTYGRVYLALNATTGEMIAVKQVELPQTASDKNDTRQHTVVQALKMESETLRDLDHPHIVQYLGFEETPANLSIFLEYVPGGSVGSCLHKHGKFADNVTRSFTAQILSGLEYLHSKGILHRDMKADNILVEMSGVCKISDFGISKRTEDLQGGAFTAMQGTVFWMAPEVVNAQKKGYNFKVDIWSVGCVVLEMWAGKRPWTGEEMVAVMFKLYQSKQPPPVPDDVVLGEDADDFRQKCFAINPEERPSAAELRKHPYLILPPGWAFTGFT